MKSFYTYTKSYEWNTKEFVIVIIVIINIQIPTRELKLKSW